MAKQATVAETKKGPIARLQEFLQDVLGELKKVTWPTKEDLKTSTKVTMIMLGVVSGITFVYDRVFQMIMILLLKITG